MLPIGNQSRTPIYPTSRTRRGASERAVLEPGEIDVLREVLPEFPGQRNVTDTILELPQIRDVRDAIQRAPVQPPDGYISKVLKYVPVEIIAPFTAIMAATVGVPEFEPNQQTVTKVIFVLFLIATPVYFWMNSRRQPEAERPVGYFYILSLFAFTIWALTIARSNACQRPAVGVAARRGRIHASAYR